RLWRSPAGIAVPGHGHDGARFRGAALRPGLGLRVHPNPGDRADHRRAFRLRPPTVRAMSGASVANIEPTAAPSGSFVRRPALSVWTILKWAIAFCAVVVAVFPIWWMGNVVFAPPGEPVSINPRLYPTSLTAGFEKIRV